MKKFVLPFAILSVLFFSAFAIYDTNVWKIASNYSIKFNSNSASGIFTNFSGTIDFDEANLAASKFDVTIEVASINTGNSLQNRHAKGAEWFDAATYPSIKFASSSITKTSTGYSVAGNLEMHGIKKSVTIPFTFKGNTFAGSFSVNRLDYGIGKAGSVDNTIKLDISVPVTK